MEDKALIIEQAYPAPIELVWRAITEPELMKKWYFDIIGFQPEVGCKFQFDGGEEGKRYTHLCEIIEIIPFQKLKYSWRYKGEEGLSYVTFELSTLDEHTILKLTHEGLATFTNLHFIRENFEGGWKYLLQESLKEFLENGKALRYW